MNAKRPFRLELLKDWAVLLQEERIFFISTGDGEPGITNWGLMPVVPPGSRTPETIETTAAAIDALPEELRAEMGHSMGVFFKVSGWRPYTCS